MPVILLGGSLPGLAPSEVTGCQLWYDASANVYTDEAGTTPAGDTDAVRAWTDRVSGYKVTTQGTASAAPVLDVDLANGRPALLFDATNDQLYTADNAADSYLGTSNTEFLVVKFTDATPAADQRIVMFYDGVNVNVSIQNIGGFTTMRATNYDGSQDVADKASLTMTSWMIITRMNNGSNVLIGHNDTRTASLTSTASGNTSFGANCNLHIRNVPATYNALQVAEIAHFNVALSEANRQEIERRLAFKFGITLPY